MSRAAFKTQSGSAAQCPTAGSLDKVCPDTLISLDAVPINIMVV